MESDSRRSRRRAVSAVAGLAGGALFGRALADENDRADVQAGIPAPPEPVADWLLRPGRTPVRVPETYLGLHSDHGLGGRTPAPRYGYDAVRTHDTHDAREYPALQWALIERAPGRYDWKAVERFVKAHPRHLRIFTLLGCPRFYQKYPREPWAYPYLPGGGSPPQDPAVAARFVQALTTRFAGAFRYVEIWNEPNFGWESTDPETGRWTPDMGLPAFFTGTAADLAAMAREVRAVLPPGVSLMAGAWEGQSRSPHLTNSLLRFSAAPDGGGGTGLDHVQALSVHLYDYSNDPNALITELRGYEKRFEQAGYSRALPRYVTELGAGGDGAWTRDAPPMAEKIRRLRRWCLIPAAFGYQGVYLYKHSRMASLGHPAVAPGVSRAIDALREELPGRTIAAAAVLRDRSVWLGFADGGSMRA